MQKNYTHIIWDWNGTLLNDVDWCFATINRLLATQQKPPLPSLAAYREVFGFPIIDYYRRAGFDLAAESYDSLAAKYIALYHGAGSESMGLFANTETVLQAVKNSGRSQVILSASSQENLFAQLAPFDIHGLFDEILGISDIFAKGKVEIGLDYIARNPVQNGLFIGDTLHDFEVAEAMGIDCVLVAQGHHSRERLQVCGVPVLADLAEVWDYLSD